MGSRVRARRFNLESGFTCPNRQAVVGLDSRDLFIEGDNNDGFITDDRHRCGRCRLDAHTFFKCSALAFTTSFQGNSRLSYISSA